MKYPSCFVLVTLTFFCCITLAALDCFAVTIETVPIRGQGNSPYLPPDGIGDVNYKYRIGTFEVTTSQYVEFLNTVDPAAANPLGLFDSNMQSNGRGHIARNLAAPLGSRYAAKAGRSNHPVNYINWFDAVRFVNWLHNGQTAGGTESGAYTLLGGSLLPTNANDIERNPGARWYLPDENEWWKAAFHMADDPGTYFTWATQSFDAPVASLPTSVPNRANYQSVANGTTPVGAYSGSPSSYGTFDQNGNVAEWIETLEDGSRGIFGGSWFYNDPILFSVHSTGWTSPEFQFSDRGFRVAAVIPEPGGTIFAIGFLAATFLRRPCRTQSN
jgi:formylglycine-generating enzyme